LKRGRSRKPLGTRGQGVGLVGKFVALAITLVVVAGIIYIIVERFKSETNNLSKCGGLVGSLGGKDGYCHAQKSCDSATPADGYYYQYIGEGFGCEQDTFCCIQIPDTSNPVRGVEVNNARCQSIKEGTWTYSKPGTPACSPIPDAVTVEIDQDITFYYKPATSDRVCTIKLGGTSGTAITLKGIQSGQHTCFEAANDNGVVPLTASVIKLYDVYGIDKSTLNHPQGEITIEMSPAKTARIKFRNSEYVFCSKQSAGTCKGSHVGATGTALVKGYEQYAGDLRGVTTEVTGKCELDPEAPQGSYTCRVDSSGSSKVVSRDYKTDCANKGTDAGDFCSPIIIAGGTGSIVESGPHQGTPFLCSINRDTGICILCVVNGKCTDWDIA
jgi:hypothetical protein